MRYEDGAVEKFGLAHVGDPPVYDDARVHDLDVLVGASLEELPDVRGVEPFTLADADGDAHVSEKRVHEEDDEIHDALFEGHKFERGGDDVRGEEPHDETDDASQDNF